MGERRSRWKFKKLRKINRNTILLFVSPGSTICRVWHLNLPCRTHLTYSNPDSMTAARNSLCQNKKRALRKYLLAHHLSHFGRLRRPF